jgi:hypothetical protein
MRIEQGVIKVGVDALLIGLVEKPPADVEGAAAEANSDTQQTAGHIGNQLRVASHGHRGGGVAKA